MRDELLHLENVRYSDKHGLPLIEDVFFSLCSGGILWVTGPSSTGKTTLLEIITKERRPDCGTVVYRGNPLWGKGSISRSQLRRQIGVVFQDDCLLQDRTVFDNAAAALRLTGCSNSVLRDRTYLALVDVGLTAKAEQQVQVLSSSEKRLLSLARVLAKMPPLVIADLNTCEVDQKMIAPRLEALASYGCGVLILSKQHHKTVAESAATAELVLR